MRILKLESVEIKQERLAGLPATDQRAVARIPPTEVAGETDHRSRPGQGQQSGQERAGRSGGRREDVAVLVGARPGPERGHVRRLPHHD